MPQPDESRRARLIGELQDRAARALPATVQETRNGCSLRHTDSFTWWAGAVLMHGPDGAATLTTRIATAEDFYAAHGDFARFQVCPACPRDLDTALSRRGYHVGSAMSLQVARTEQIARQPPAPRLRADLKEHPDPAWFQLWMSVQAPDADPAPEWSLLRRVDRPSGYVTVSTSGEPVAIGRAVADTGWAGVFGMATLPYARGQGAASAVLSGLGRWAISQRAARMYLQVEHDNPAAHRVYRRAGFTELCAYHYRTASAS